MEGDGGAGFALYGRGGALEGGFFGSLRLCVLGLCILGLGILGLGAFPLCVFRIGYLGWCLVIQRVRWITVPPGGGEGLGVASPRWSYSPCRVGGAWSSVWKIIRNQCFDHMFEMIKRFRPVSIDLASTVKEKLTLLGLGLGAPC